MHKTEPKLAKMNKFYALILVACFFSKGHTQEENSTSILSKKKHVETVKIIEKESFSVADSTQLTFKEHPKSNEIDSLWKLELMRSDLFQEMQALVKSVDLEESVSYAQLTTETLKKRLQILDSKTPFQVGYSPILENTIKKYLSSGRKSWQRLMNMSNFYFPLFEQELDKHNLPLELKYLPIVESALNPRAKSSMGATGLWQFMYPTGKMFGLEVSSYVDERADPIKATSSAAKYLASLYQIFDDWNLALASYNAGPGTVSKAIRRSNGATNYWVLREYLPQETAGYVPAFLATMYLFEFAHEHGFEVPKTGLPLYKTDTIHVKQTLVFEQLSQLIDLPLEELRFLNPSYKLDIIPAVEGKKYTLRLPLESMGTFLSNEQTIYKYIAQQIEEGQQPLPQFIQEEQRIRYRVKSGDFLGKIANQHGVSVKDIKRWNNLKNNNLKIGQRLVIYSRGNGSPSTTIAQSSSKSTSVKEYVVKKGDSLWSIAQQFPGVSIENLKKWNGFSGTKLKPGMKIKVSKG